MKNGTKYKIAIFIFIFKTCAQPVLALELKDLEKVSPPAVGAYHGAYADFGATEDDVTEAKIHNFESQVGKKIVWAYFSNHWIDGLIKFPWRSVKACLRAQVIPYIRLSPWSEMKQNHGDPVFTMKKILRGDFDKDLIAWAEEAKFADFPLMIEFGPEVNGDWFPWNGRWNGAGSRTSYGDPKIPDGPERFRDAYARIIEIFKRVGARKITWVLHVDASRSPDSEWNRVKYYYPGDDLIDYIGVSVFGAQLPTHDWNNFSQKLQKFMPEIDQASLTKPLLISEFAVIESADSKNKKAEWLTESLSSISEGEFPRVKGITYWNSPGWLANGKANFKLDSSPQALEAYREEIQKSFWIESLTPRL